MDKELALKCLTILARAPLTRDALGVVAQIPTHDASAYVGFLLSFTPPLVDVEIGAGCVVTWVATEAGILAVANGALPEVAP